MTTESIASTLQSDTPAIRSTLSRLKSQHHVESPSRGEYRALHHGGTGKTEGGENDA
jgi:hypothetical protein